MAAQQQEIPEPPLKRSIYWVASPRQRIRTPFVGLMEKPSQTISLRVTPVRPTPKIPAGLNRHGPFVVGLLCPTLEVPTPQTAKYDLTADWTPPKMVVCSRKPLAYDGERGLWGQRPSKRNPKAP